MAKFITLGLDKIAAPPRPGSTAHQAGVDLTEYGASGTPIFGGFVRERGEYNSDLQGLHAITVYEQMRRSDAQVAATLMATKLPIQAAEWDVNFREGVTPSPVEEEARAFVRKCLFHDLDFSAVLRNALLMLDFGCAVHEDVYEMINGQVRLKKLAPRLPITFYRWIVDETGEDLVALEQLGYRGAEYVTAQIPASKMARFTFEQEGANFTGKSLLRAMYQHWYMKGELYKIDAISLERNGSGIPVITMGPQLTKEDKALGLQWIEQLTAHQKAGLMLPPGWSFALHGVQGTLRDAMPSITHHNAAISMAGLTMFMMLGQSQAGGSRALGDTMSDFFFQGLDATALQIAQVLTLTTVRRLVNLNFGGIRNYPRVTVQKLLTLKFETIVNALQQLASSGVVTPDEKLERWARDKFGAPERKIKAVMSPAAAITASSHGGGRLQMNFGLPKDLCTGRHQHVFFGGSHDTKTWKVK